MEFLSLFLDYVVIPLLLWIWSTDRKVVKLEAQKITNDDLEKIYNELKELRKEFHDNSKQYVTTDFCTLKDCKK